ncbi:MAG: helix-turn-helix domain-containing protein [Ignavibacteria bacterium]|nr:helix-turn-helix domain-containing protein [Ignavibacteria bacterium]
MKQKLLTSSQVAELINVNVSTVKRWTDSGEIKCTHTLGKHRKYRIQDIIEFATKNHIQINPSLYYPEGENNEEIRQINFAVYSNDYQFLSNAFYNYILSGNKSKAENLLKLIYGHKVPLGTICDSVIASSLKHIGKDWYENRIGIETEHLASNIALHSIIKLQDVIIKKKPKGFVSLCGCLTDEFHNIGITCVNNLLESEGWESYLLGSNTPASSFIKMIELYKPHLVCISTSVINDVKTFTEEVNAVYKFTKKHKGRLAVSGQSLTPEMRNQIRTDYTPDSTNRILEILGEIEFKTKLK